MARTLFATVFATAVLFSNAAAQVTGLPNFNAPYRAFDRHEAGFSVAFPGFDDTAIEGLYRFGSGNFDIGLRGGIWLVRGPAVDDEIFMLGVEARQRLVTHSESFPFDGALIFGAGAHFGWRDNFIPTVGFSVGRRVDIADSDISIVLYGEPTMWMFVGDGNEDVAFSIGFGADIRFSPRFDLRVGLGAGDIDGLSITSVWIR